MKFFDWLFGRPLSNKIQLSGRTSERFHEFNLNRNNEKEPWSVYLHGRFVSMLSTYGEYPIGVPGKIYVINWKEEVDGEVLIDKLRELSR